MQKQPAQECSLRYILLLALLCQLTDISFELNHLDGQTQWSTMRCGCNCQCHWCTIGTVTDVVTMMWDVFKRLGVEEAPRADPFQLSKTIGEEECSLKEEELLQHL